MYVLGLIIGIPVLVVVLWRALTWQVEWHGWRGDK